MPRYGRFTHRCIVCGKGQYVTVNSSCHKAEVMAILAIHERKKCDHEYLRLEVGGVDKWPSMCIKCGGMSR